MYDTGVPKLWNATIEAHREAVREAILETTAALVTERGLSSVKMSQIAERAGIGRATLYKYFPDVESILVAWHQQLVAGHLARLAELRDREGSPEQRLGAVLGAYAQICFHRARHGGADLSALVHQDEAVAGAERQLVDLFGGLLTEAADAGWLRTELPPEELANYCLHALAAAGSLRSEEAVQRLVDFTLQGMSRAR